MLEPTDFRIYQNVRDALQAIDTRDGYYFTLPPGFAKLDPDADVEALLADGKARPLILIERQPETREYLPSFRVRVSQFPRIHWLGDTDPANDESRLQTFARACADIEKALTVDTGRGGLAADTRIVSQRIWDWDGSQIWVVVDVEVFYQRIYGLPTEPS